ncbi:8322_t:CDS:2, partial [Funneliformis geosporum]
MGGIAQKVPIPVDLPNTRGPCYDYQLYFEKKPLDAESDFYLQTNPKYLANKTGIEVDGHRSIDAIRKYKVPNDQQKMDTLQHIISTYNLQDHQESQIKNITDNV